MLLKYVLLALIKLRPAVSGYELKTIIDRSTGYFFSASLSQIYPALKDLNDKGYITYREEPLTGRQDRKVYTITEKGLEYLHDWLLEPPDFSFSMMSFQKFLLKLTFMGPIDKKDILAYLYTGLEHYTKEKKEFMDENLTIEENYLDKKQKDSKAYLSIWKHEFEYIIEENELRINWIKKTIKRIESQ